MSRTLINRVIRHVGKAYTTTSGRVSYLVRREGGSEPLSSAVAARRSLRQKRLGRRDAERRQPVRLHRRVQPPRRHKRPDGGQGRRRSLEAGQRLAARVVGELIARHQRPADSRSST